VSHLVMPDAIVDVGEDGARFGFDHRNLRSLAGKCLDPRRGSSAVRYGEKLDLTACLTPEKVRSLVLREFCQRRKNAFGCVPPVVTGVIGRRLTAPDACNHSPMALIQHAGSGLLHRHSQMAPPSPSRCDADK
jgi:hypothetical protein